MHCNKCINVGIELTLIVLLNYGHVISLVIRVLDVVSRLKIGSSWLCIRRDMT